MPHVICPKCTRPTAYTHELPERCAFCGHEKEWLLAVGRFAIDEPTLKLTASDKGFLRSLRIKGE